MTTVHVRVVELRTSEAHTRINKLLLFFETRSSPKPFRGDVEVGTPLHCEGAWTFSVLNQSSEFLAITLKRRRFFSADEVIAKCVLPLTWFATNRMVREWFPMVNESDQSGADLRAMIRLDVHIDTRFAEQFMAAFANLRVIPTWARPSENEDASPAPPQVVYVVGEPPVMPGAPVSYRPVACAQYPDPAHQVGVPAPSYGFGAPPSMPGSFHP
jgi:hypothetical protein